MTEPIRITGAKHVYTLQEGEQWAIYNDTVIVVHPDRKPKIVNSDGAVEELEFSPCVSSKQT